MNVVIWRKSMHNIPQNWKCQHKIHNLLSQAATKYYYSNIVVWHILKNSINNKSLLKNTLLHVKILSFFDVLFFKRLLKIKKGILFLYCFSLLFASKPIWVKLGQDTFTISSSIVEFTQAKPSNIVGQ